jgi:hypothetical protein
MFAANLDKIFVANPNNIFAVNLNPNDTFLAKYEINSIKTKRGNKPNGQPAGTNKAKIFKSCF